MKAILFCLDTLRADHLSCYGYPRKTSPNMDRLAEEGAVFLDATSAFSCTLPSFTSILCGKLPLNHKMIVNPWGTPNVNSIVLDDETPTLAEVLLEAGFTTAAFDNLINFKSHPKWFVRGYQYYVNVTRSPEPVHHHILADWINEPLLPWLEAHKNRDFFLFVHYWDPHKPYNAPPPYDGLYSEKKLKTKTCATSEEYIIGSGRKKDIGAEEIKMINLYDGEINYVDDRLEQVFQHLKRLGIYEQCLILITSDHGEIMAEKAAKFQHRGIWHPTMHVPLIVKAPGISKMGLNTPALVHHIDIMPTILDALGVEFAGKLDGMSLVPLLTGQKTSLREEVVGEGTYCGVPQRFIKDAQFKFIKNYKGGIQDLTANYDRGPMARPWEDAPERELYDLKSDPEELLNLAQEKKALADEMEKRLEKWLASVKDDPEAPDPFSKEMREALERDARLIN